MASRMDKYYGERSEDLNRNQKNQLLYDRLEYLEEDDKTHLIDSLSRTIESDLAKLDEILKGCADYKRDLEQQALKKDLDILNDQTYDSKYMRTNTRYHNSAKNVITGNNRKIKRVKAKDKKIRELIDMILNTSYSNKYGYENPNKSKYFDYQEEIKETRRVKKKSEKFLEISKIFQFLDSDDTSDERKLNLRVKAIVGIIFLINTIIIVFMICNALK